MEFQKEIKFNSNDEHTLAGEYVKISKLVDQALKLYEDVTLNTYDEESFKRMLEPLYRNKLLGQIKEARKIYNDLSKKCNEIGRHQVDNETISALVNAIPTFANKIIKNLGDCADLIKTIEPVSIANSDRIKIYQLYLKIIRNDAMLHTNLRDLKNKPLSTHSKVMRLRAEKNKNTRNHKDHIIDINPPSLLGFPKEIWGEIMGFLEDKDLVKLSEVNRAARLAVNNFFDKKIKSLYDDDKNKAILKKIGDKDNSIISSSQNMNLSPHNAYRRIKWILDKTENPTRLIKNEIHYRDGWNHRRTATVMVNATILFSILGFMFYFLTHGDEKNLTKIISVFSSLELSVLSTLLCCILKTKTVEIADEDEEKELETEKYIIAHHLANHSTILFSNSGKEKMNDPNKKEEKKADEESESSDDSIFSPGKP